MPPWPSKLFYPVALSFALLLLPFYSYSQCVPWDDSSVSVSQLDVPAKAHKAFTQSLAAIKIMDETGARKAIAKALKIDPRYPAALIISALFAIEDSRLDDAARDAKSALSSDPNYHGAVLTLAAVENARRNYEEGERLARSVTAPCASFWWTYYEQAKALVGRRKYPAALAILREAETRVTYRNALLRIPKAFALEGLNQRYEAIHELEVFLRECPCNSVDLHKVHAKLASLKAYVATEVESRRQIGASGTE
jgi:tetratricopeptide (TPR) repeat protein